MCFCGHDHDDALDLHAGARPDDAHPAEEIGVSRRDMFRHSAASVLGAGALLAQATARGQAPTQAPGTGGASPAVAPAPNMQKGVIYWGNGIGNVDPDSLLAERQGPTKTTGLKFKGLVRYANTLQMETMTMLPIHPLHVVVRMQATQTCYSSVGQLSTTAKAPFAAVAGHGGVGIVEEVGRLVKRVKPGDQVFIATTPNCGVCANCLSGRGDLCAARLPAIPSATMSDNTPVYMTAPVMGPAGYAEYIVSDEDWIVPVFTKVPPAELSVLACVGGTGLGMAMCRFPVEAGTDVAVFGLGPIGISAVQGARIQGAKVIIGIDPIKYRRDLALKLGATHVLDPNVERGNDLINKIRALTPDAVPVGRRYAGEHAAGPLYAFEAVGGTRYPLPAQIEKPVDMTGVEPLQQAWTVVRAGGIVRTCSIGHPAGANVTFPAGQWANAAKTHVPGNYAGVQALRDLPRFVRLIESGAFDAKSLVGQVFGMNQAREAVLVTAERTAITSIITMS